MRGLQAVIAAHGRGFDPFGHRSRCFCGWASDRHFFSEAEAAIDAHAAHVAEAVTAWVTERFDATLEEMSAWCGPFGYPGVAAFIDRRDAYLRAAIAAITEQAREGA